MYERWEISGDIDEKDPVGRKKWMIQKKEGNYNDNSWRKGDGTRDIDWGVGFDGQVHVVHYKQKRRQRTCITASDGKIWRWENEGASDISVMDEAKPSAV